MTREEAIETLKENLCAMCAYGSQSMMSCDIRGCDNRDAIKALEQEPSKDCISRLSLVNKIEILMDMYGNDFYWAVRKIIDDAPSVQPKMGRWVFVDKAKEHARCSECDYGNVDLFDGKPHNYCENCGRKMQEAEE